MDASPISCWSHIYAKQYWHEKQHKSEKYSYSWYPAKRALPAMLRHGSWGPFGYHQYQDARSQHHVITHLWTNAQPGVKHYLSTSWCEGINKSYQNLFWDYYDLSLLFTYFNKNFSITVEAARLQYTWTSPSSNIHIWPFKSHPYTFTTRTTRTPAF